MGSWSTKMGKDFGIVTAGLFKSVRQNGKAIEGSVVVNGLGQVDHAGRQPGWIHGNDAGRVGEDFSNQLGLGKQFAGFRTDQSLGASLSAAGSISGGYCGLCGGSVPSGLAGCP